MPDWSYSVAVTATLDVLTVGYAGERVAGTVGLVRAATR